MKTKKKEINKYKMYNFYPINGFSLNLELVVYFPFIFCHKALFMMTYK